MCLLSYRNKPFISTKEIKCYKVFLRSGKSLYGPFCLNKVGENNSDTDSSLCGTIYKADKKYGSKPIASSYRYPHQYDICGGYIHTFQNLDDIEKCFKKGYFELYQEYEIYECTIPTGTEYYIGYTGMHNQYQGFASREIKLDKLIKHKIYN